MKLSNIILTGICLFCVAGLIASNIVLKKEYTKIDKSDIYWTFDKVSAEPFKHIVVEGGNKTQIIYEQNKNFSVRINKRWAAFKDSIKISVQHDTLLISFPAGLTNQFRKNNNSLWVLVRIFAPRLLTVSGNNTNLLMSKFYQKKLEVNLKGKSEFNMESMTSDLDYVKVTLNDSSRTSFNMSVEFIGPKILRVGTLQAEINNWSQLGIGNCLIKNLDLHIGDSASIQLSGADFNHSKIKVSTPLRPSI